MPRVVVEGKALHMSREVSLPAAAVEPRARPSRASKGMLGASVTLGRVAGVSIGLNWSWLAIVALVVASLGVEVFPTENPGLSGGVYALMAIVATLLFFASLLLHELGHAVQARREGVEIEGITLWLFGGVARFKSMFPSPGAEFRIAIAGPLVTLAIAGVLLLFARLAALPAAVDGVITWLGYVNAFLLAFNLLPALPLDGGRVLRATVWRLRGDLLEATRFAGALGRFMGQFMIVLGLLGAFLYGAPGGIWLAFIGWFLVVAATSEAALIEAREALSGMRVGDAMSGHPVVVEADLTLDDFVTTVFASRRYTAYPVVDGGQVVGFLPFASVAAVPPDRWAEERVRDHMDPMSETLLLDEDAPLPDTLPELSQSRRGRGVVCAEGRPRGVLSLTDVRRLLDLRADHRALDRSR